MTEQQRYDVIIIGGSYSGLAAAMALGRALRKILIIDDQKPCNRQTPYSHNFLTNDGKPPSEIAKAARQELQQYPTVSFLNGTATRAINTGKGFDIALDSGETYSSAKLIFATGISDLMPDIPGFAESWGISVLHCPYCHGYEVRGQKTGIMADGDLAFEFTSLISNWTSDLALYTNGPSNLRADQLQLLDKHNIPVTEKKIMALEQEKGMIHRIVFDDGHKEDISALYARLPFTQRSALPASLGCELTPDGYIKVDEFQRTSVNGVFACGDNCSRMRTVANAVSMGTTTGIVVNKEFVTEKFVSL